MEDRPALLLCFPSRVHKGSLLRRESQSMSHGTRGWTILLGLGLLLVASCARSPEAQKLRHLERGDRDVKRAQYRDAILEYRNVLRFDPANERALRQLGVLHYQFGELAQAFRYLLKAEEVAPDALDVRVKLGMIYLLAGKTDETKREVTFVLAKESRNVDGLALLASMASTPQQVDGAIQRLEAAQADVGDRAKLHLALGVLYLRKQDVARAERAFQEAVAREPQLPEPHLALGQLYLATQNSSQAEREFKAAAAIAPVGSPARLRLADFYLLAQKPDEAKRTLLEITRSAPAYLPAWRRLAEMSFQERNYDESLRALQVLLTETPSDLD
jgi:tetratricopeptide (TPR) repeat protein